MLVAAQMGEPAVVAVVRRTASTDGHDLVDGGRPRIRVREVGVDELAAQPAEVLFGEDLGAQFAPAVAVGVAGVAQPSWHGLQAYGRIRPGPGTRDQLPSCWQLVVTTDDLTGGSSGRRFKSCQPDADQGLFSASESSVSARSTHTFDPNQLWPTVEIDLLVLAQVRRGSQRTAWFDPSRDHSYRRRSTRNFKPSTESRAKYVPNRPLRAAVSRRASTRVAAALLDAADELDRLT